MRTAVNGGENACRGGGAYVHVFQLTMEVTIGRVGNRQDAFSIYEQYIRATREKRDGLPVSGEGTETPERIGDGSEMHQYPTSMRRMYHSLIHACKGALFQQSPSGVSTVAWSVCLVVCSTYCALHILTLDTYSRYNGDQYGCSRDGNIYSERYTLRHCGQ